MSAIPRDSLLPVQAGFVADAPAAMPQQDAPAMPTVESVPDPSVVGTPEAAAPAQDLPPIDLSTLEPHETEFLQNHFGEAIRAEAEAKFKEDKAALQRTYEPRLAAATQQIEQLNNRVIDESTMSQALMTELAQILGDENQLAAVVLRVQQAVGKNQQARTQTVQGAQQFVQQERQNFANELERQRMDGTRELFQRNDPEIANAYIAYERAAQADLRAGSKNPQLNAAAIQSFNALRGLLQSKREAALRGVVTPTAPAAAQPQVAPATAAALEMAQNRQLADARGPQQRAAGTGGGPSDADSLMANARTQVQAELGRPLTNADYAQVHRKFLELRYAQ